MAIHRNLTSKAAARFWSKVERGYQFRPRECWHWTAAKDQDGYGIFSHGDENEGSHRIAYRLTRGRIPLGLMILHSCDTRHCVNPAHMRLGTQRENMEDMRARARGILPPPMAGWNRKCIPKGVIDRLGKEPDRTIAAEIGISPSVIARRRREHGIKAWRRTVSTEVKNRNASAKGSY
jgi:HNH endonuclease